MCKASGKSCPATVSKAAAVGVMAALALWCVGCADTSQQTSTKEPRIIPDQQDSSKFDLPAHHFIYRGMETDRLKSLVGSPLRKEETGQGQEWYYDWGMILLRKGKVHFKYPPSRGVENPAPSPDEGQQPQPSPQKQQ